MKQRFYFDTSVFGGVYDVEFDELSLQLFEKVKLGEIICVYSDLTVGEFDNASEQIKNFFESFPSENMEYIRISDESLALAKQYIADKVVGETSFDDCIHIALATIHKADILVAGILNT
jgi:predicted nucleic acid-binding protein